MATDYRKGCKFSKYGVHKFKQTDRGRIRVEEKDAPQQVGLSCQNPGCGIVYSTTLYWGITTPYFSLPARK